MKRATGLVMAASIFALACGAGPGEDTAATQEPVQVESAPVAVILDRPFTAEQIREEWVEGFELRVRRWTAEAEAFERWNVVRADADGVDIEAVEVDENGAPVGEARTRSSTWVQLRDHASFAADRATRERITRETPLGEFPGWLYEVGDPDAGTATEFFFAEDMPGAPVFVHVYQDEELVEIFEQIERHRPADDE